ncbi:ABC-three component system protein [Streptococcus orisratti]|uniref:ABC-three component system protein n=1 Tax=Streptococcus orisratti TaxID=114652 RepID=UPI002AADE568|nr:hypothetical protein [Streptococcus suis]
MEYDFRYLVGKYGEAGAREKFEKICIEAFQEKFGPKAKEVAVSQGDDGIDILVGELNDRPSVYQCKFFINGIGESQKQQIRNSFSTVITSHPNISSWYLCVPIGLNIQELQWWSTWKSKMKAQHKIKIELCDGAFLLKEFKKCSGYNSTFDDGIRNDLEQVRIFLEDANRRVYEEVLYGEDDIDDISAMYNDTVFISMLKSAQIIEVEDFKIDFYNAEIARHEARSKDNINGERQYANLRRKIYSIWQTQYRQYKHASDGNTLIDKTYLRVEDLDSSTLESQISSFNLLAKKGILHQLADDKKLGWVDNYLEVLDRYMEVHNDRDN